MDKERVDSIKKLSNQSSFEHSRLSGEWIKIERKRKYTPSTSNIDVIHPSGHFWCGFNPLGREKWFIELNNGRIVSGDDENYHYWLKKYRNLK